MTSAKNSGLVKYVGALALLAPLAGRAMAQAEAAVPSPSQPATGERLAAPTGDPELRAAITPYLWAPSLSGDTTIRGVDIDVDVSFSDIVDNADSIYAFMGAVELEYGRALFQFNGSYMHIGMDEQTGRGGVVKESVSADLDVDVGWFEFAGGWRFVDKPLGEGEKRRFKLDGLLGARLTTFDMSTNVTAVADITLPDGTVLARGVGKEFTRSEDWVELFVGAGMRVDLTQRWTMGLRGDVGGFDLGPDQFAWQTIGFFAYKFPMGDSTTGALVLGFRALSQDYENNSFQWNVVAYGPLLGFSIQF